MNSKYYIKEFFFRYLCYSFFSFLLYLNRKYTHTHTSPPFEILCLSLFNSSVPCLTPSCEVLNFSYLLFSHLFTSNPSVPLLIIYLWNLQGFTIHLMRTVGKGTPTLKSHSNEGWRIVMRLICDTFEVNEK